MTNNYNNNQSKTMTLTELEKIFQQIVNHRTLFKKGYIDKKLYPYYTSLPNLFKHVFYFKYISNISFILMVFSYFVGAYKIFQIFLAITISNCIIFLFIMLGDFNQIIYGLLGNDIFKKLPMQVRKYIIDKDSAYIYPSFIIIAIISHLVSVVIGLILYYHYTNKSSNFLSMFGLSVLFISGFILIAEKQLYGDIKEELYLSLYFPILFITCYYLYPPNIH
jgi:hypothetical protein